MDVVEVPEANDWNLAQLHKPSGSYNYTADLSGDLEYLMRSGRGLLPFRTDDTRLLGNRKEPVPNPAQATLENLLDLAKFDPTDEYVAGLQTMWFARLAVDDPSSLARERCVEELGRHGERLGIGLPVPLPPDAKPVGPGELGPALAELIREYRLSLQRTLDERDVARMDEVCDALQALVLDLEGARRVLYVANQLLRRSSPTELTRPRVVELSRDVQRRCVEQALARALGDPVAAVRAAAIVACTRAAGTAVLGPILLQLDREPSDLVVLSVMRLVAEHGLPDKPEGLDEAAHEQLRERWLEHIYDIAVDAPDGQLRVHGMRALERCLGPGIESLRPEEWERWWLERRRARPAAAVGGPAP